jgi:hypothetical protein
MLFAADEEGSVHAYKLPLSPADCQVQRCGRGPISRISVNFDETLLFAATHDGSIFVYDVKDRVGRLGVGGGANQSVMSCKCVWVAL